MNLVKRRPFFKIIFSTSLLLGCALGFLLATQGLTAADKTSKVSSEEDLSDKTGFVGPVTVQKIKSDANTGAATTLTPPNAVPNQAAPQAPTVIIPPGDEVVEPEFPKEFRDYWKQECHRFFPSSNEFDEYKSCYDYLMQRAREYQEDHYSLEEFDTDEHVEVYVHNVTLKRLEEKERSKGAKPKKNVNSALAKKIEKELDEISQEASPLPLELKASKPMPVSSPHETTEIESTKPRATGAATTPPLIEIDEIDLNQKTKTPALAPKAEAKSSTEVLPVKPATQVPSR